MRIADPFRAGLLIGLGAGMFLSGVFVEQHALTPRTRLWVLNVGVLLLVVGEVMRRRLRMGARQGTDARP